MPWSKVNNKYSKPFLWWYHKYLCEIGYWIEKKFNSVAGMRMYYKHLNKLCSKGYNLYGDKI